MASNSDALLVARIGKPHGLRGEVTVQVHTDDPMGRFVAGQVFDTEAAPGTGVPRRLTLATARKHREIWLLGFAEIPDRTGAESLRGTRLLLDVTSADIEGEEDEDEGFYEHDLVGLAVHDPSGAALGEVTGLLVGAAQDLLEVRLSDGRDVLVPFVEAIVTEVDLDGGHVVVDAPAGLFDLDEA
ncbi:ribosome maturation factor RimM [Knoellia subterranea]|uniref:Ribosome maturation factor RimM n=1 Tax=Knoellia subterranea KCTC 19937 TaxID=1385521 RepID=A0A0A0JIY5_9MICO|nr:ribosome maturation factor RimM [Knoellia subterranea]KGN36744.1 16S rRNA-processing protein RimM [Knoellia subterranea KCTC 19937]